LSISRETERSNESSLLHRRAAGIHVAVDEISHLEIAPVGTGRDPLGEATDAGPAHFAYRLSVDFQKRDVGFIVPIKAVFGVPPVPFRIRDAAYPPAGLIANPSGPSPTTT